MELPLCGSQGHFLLLFHPKAPSYIVVYSSCSPTGSAMWDTASAWLDEQCHVHALDLNQRNSGPPAAERANLTTLPRGQPQVTPLLLLSWTLYRRGHVVWTLGPSGSSHGLCFCYWKFKAKGVHLRKLRNSPNICFCVEVIPHRSSQSMTTCQGSLEYAQRCQHKH